MRFITVTSLIFILSNNLLLGQQIKNPRQMEFFAARQCSGIQLKKESPRLEILLPESNIFENLSSDCSTREFSPSEQLEASSFFGFAAF